jgi:DNA (cytosine-5)-methyltransferase 1
MREPPRLLDLCSGAGGATVGYQAAGFHVTGVDRDPQPNYPGHAFVRADALAYLRSHGHEYAAIHASFPCQAWTAYRRKGHGVGVGYPDLITPGRALLVALGRPYVMENVELAPLIGPVRLCGSSFGLDVRRHRLFETSFPVPPLACNHAWQTPRFPSATNRANRRSTVEVGVWRIPLDIQRAAMGISWMTRAELSEAVPPPYTRYIGTHLRAALDGAARSVRVSTEPWADQMAAIWSSS